MYETLLAKIGTILDGVSLVKEHFSTPSTIPAKFPAVFFKPAGSSNSFETQTDNAKIYRFLVLVLVGANGTTVEDIFSGVLPKTVDAITEAFDAAWDGGVKDGHRIYVKLNSADEWQVSEEGEGVVCWAPLYLEVKVLTPV